MHETYYCPLFGAGLVPVRPAHCLRPARLGSFQSGIGVISGWACEAQTIEISFNGGPRLRAALGTIREDTQGVCGDTDNGFGLLYNWNRLGDGAHTVTAYAAGVEFASVTVTVTTLGTEFLRGASGAFMVSDFPAAGATRTLRWQEAQQNFVITAGDPQGGGTSGAAPHILENPQPGSFQSGVGVISGWACDAQTIEISFDGGPRIQAGTGTIREDTRGVCGDTNNGFGLLYNWNRLGDGPHTVTAYADGVEFAQVTVTVSTLGEEFRRGLRREVTLSNFPAAGTNVVLRWQEAQQNFVITQTTSTPVSAHLLPDANLRRAVEEALDKPPGATITKAELATLRGLAASDYGIIDLTGLEFATNLTWLYLGTNEIVDISPLAGLVNLTTLSLGSNTITDLSPLVGLVNLTTLSLGYNTITDLSPLAGLVNLTDLNLSSNEIVDISPLAGLVNLTDLDLLGNTITDLSPLAGLVNLTTLDLSPNKIVDISPLAGLVNLTNLYLSGNTITDFSPLAGLVNLTDLYLLGNTITDLSPLTGLVNLTTLVLSYNTITDLFPLAGLVNLTTLVLSYNTITDLSPLAGLVNLERLYIRQTFVMDLVPLFSLTKLTSLYIDNAPVRQEDIDTLAKAGVAVDGSPGVPSTPDDMEIHHDNVIVMHLSELPFTSSNLSLLAYTRRIYEEFEDAFDYLMFFFNLVDFPAVFPFGLYTGVKNDTQGIGKRIFDDPRYGSKEHLRGVVFFPFRHAIGYGPSLHELMHTWANDAVPTSVSAHWGFSSADGQLGGFPLRDLVHLGGDRYTVQSPFGTFANGGNGVPYSPIELYFAGLIPPDDVPDLWVAEDGEWLIENGKFVWSDDGWPIFTATKVRTITIDDIIVEHGERIPDWTTSQKDFRAAVVLLVDDDHPATPTQIQEVSNLVSWFSHPGNDDDPYDYNYYEATGGRGSITMDGLSEFLLSD